jgi:hypothetical protein
VCNTGTTSNGSCPNGDGYYCGGNVGLNPTSLYQCTGGNYQLVQVCGNTCDQGGSSGAAAMSRVSTQAVTTTSAAVCKMADLSSELIFPVETDNQNVNDLKIEPGYGFGAGPIYSWKYCTFGKTPEDNKSKKVYHTAIDIIAADAKGTNEVLSSADEWACLNPSQDHKYVVAVGDGLITEARMTYDNSGKEEGWLIIEQLDVKEEVNKQLTTIYAFYMHVNMGGGIAKGQRINKGTGIGTIKYYEPAHNPHLHFEIRTSGEWLNGYTEHPPQEYGYLNPCAVIKNHGGAVPVSCANVLPSGGSVISNDAKARVDFPADAVNQNVQVQIQSVGGTYVPPLSSNTSQSSSAYQLYAINSSNEEVTRFNNQVGLTMTYDPSTLQGQSPDKMDIYYYNTGLLQWVKVTAGRVVDTVNHTIKVLTDHFSEYAVAVENNPPTVTQISDQTVVSGQNFTEVDLNTYFKDTDPGEKLTWSYSGNFSIGISVSGGVATLAYPAGWTGSETITFKATDQGNKSVSSTATFTVNAATPLFTGQYFNNMNLEGNAAYTNTTSTIDYEWNDSPAPGINADNFSVRWTGRFNFPATGDYTFIGIGDDGVKAYVDGNEVFNAWVDQAQSEYRGLVHLTAGAHDVEFDFYENGGRAYAKFYWVAGNQMPVYPACTTNGGEWCAKYYNNMNLEGNPVVTRQEFAAINYDWGTYSPVVNVISDLFSVRWVGKYYFQTGNYTFITDADDGIRVYIDDVLLTDRWGGAYGPENISRNMTAGAHTIRVEYNEFGGGAYVKFDWIFNGAVTNKPPVITSSPVMVVDENKPYKYDVNATDPENDALTYSLAQSAGTMAIDFATGLITWFPGHSDAGIYPIKVAVSDGVNTSIQIYNLTVRNVQDAPILTQIPGQKVYVGDSFNKLNLNNYVTRPADKSGLTWSTSGNAYIQVFVDNGVATFIFQPYWAGSENITFTVTDQYGQSASSTATYTVQGLPACAMGQYVGYYYSNTNVSGIATNTSCETSINHSWGTGAPIAGVPADNFSAKWTRTWLVQTPGTYNFTVKSDDGVRLYVDNVLKIDHWVAHTLATDQINIYLDWGDHTLRMEYYDKVGAATAILNITPVNKPPVVKAIPGQAIYQTQTFNTIDLSQYVTDPDGDAIDWTATGNKNVAVTINGSMATLDYPYTWVGSEVITFKATDKFGATASKAATFRVSAPVTCPAGQYKAQYFNNMNFTGLPAITRCEGIPQYEWNGDSPLPGINADNFSVRWTGTINFAQAGQYRFTTSSDDGIRLYVDGVAVINNWTDHAWTDNTGSKKLVAGNHTIRMDYYENGGGAIAKLSIAGPGHAPVINPIPVQVKSRGDYFFNINLPYFLSDSDADDHHDWDILSHGTMISGYINGDQLEIYTPYNWIGIDYITVKVTDSYGLSSTMKITFTSSDPGNCIPGTDKFCVDYYANTNLAGAAVFTTTEPVISHNWGVGSPNANVPKDYFSARWQTNRKFTAGVHKFTTNTDNGVRLYVDGQLIIDNWISHTLKSASASMYLDAGYHLVQNGVLRRNWSGCSYSFYILSKDCTPSEITLG